MHKIDSFTSQVERIESCYDVSLLLTPNELTSKPYLVKGIKNVILIDTLRNSTSITTGLAAGATEILLYGKDKQSLHDLTIDANSYNDSKIFAGEIEGRPIDGFDLGNSPLEFKPHIVKDKRIFYSSTNNGGALNTLLSLKKDISVYWACMLNAEEISNAIGYGLIKFPLLILCSGFRGSFAREDLICAGMVLDMIMNNFDISISKKDDGVSSALDEVGKYFTNGKINDVNKLYNDMKDWRCGNVLTELGQENDILLCINGYGLTDELLKKTKKCIPHLTSNINRCITKLIIDNKLREVKKING